MVAQTVINMPLKLKLKLKLTTLVLLSLSFICSTHATRNDICCLKEIKASLEDPFGYLNSTWNFNSQTAGFICKFTGVECWHPDESKVLNIRLSGMGLKGTFPRGLGYCKSLAGLDLSNNKLFGTLPSDISKLLGFVTTLDLSFNNFSGGIPKSLANCSYLNVVKLDHNRLTGNIPEGLLLLRRLKEFNVSNNLLSGKVPYFESKFIIAQSYANNSQFCGVPLEPCLFYKHYLYRHYLNSVTPFKFGFGIGYLVTAIAVFLSLSLSWLQVKMITKCMVLSVGEKFHNRKQDYQLLHFPTLKHQKLYTHYRMLRTYLQSLKHISQLEKMVNRMSFLELCKATNNFSMANVIGRGNTGTMYKATLPNGWFLAVKRIEDSPRNESLFVSELLALARMKHDNLTPLLGFCMVENERLLVYKHMSNGNLHDCLHPVEGNAKILPWPLRVKIGMGIARGLAWLHHKCIFQMVHRKISSSCVLLDRYYEPKISNFGHTIISNYGGVMFVYPNENDSGLLVNSGVWESDFVKKDVYDCGAVLLELITGKEAGSGCVTNLHNTLVEWISHVSNSSDIFNDAIDKTLNGEGFDGEILDVLRIAKDCVHPVPCKRPTMLQVYERMSNIGLRYGIPCDFGLLLQPKCR
ncbi:probably inactive leucine-rich repeat receptor-like protein kinase At5g48380 [Humulus lupulus]|uniref:probably inactive leucine-rich repeat receptor-like protein kinase At5g48380 n=1 Tax=Humulus lupulus TaxID=3486 RepID=UPI002B405831|nr:probably inactive leucine-rich repeat receptor-like protein kinase At5g48380 [Humulus lupulus]